ncbi:MAG: Smr/MutS family protein, partial [Sneathiella sp.]|nr:Smr/MutS family protein [Sneathiella sp.]
VLPSTRQNVPGLDRNTSEKLRRERLQIEGRVDLHGHTRKEAHSRLRSFLGSAHRQGKRCVLVITGKGSSVRQTEDAPFMSGSGRGILREEVPKWLAQSDLRRLVLDYRTAQAKHGGEGALYILLKRARR